MLCFVSIAFVKQHCTNISGKKLFGGLYTLLFGLGIHTPLQGYYNFRIGLIKNNVDTKHFEMIPI